MQHPAWALVIVGLVIAGIGVVWLLVPHTSNWRGVVRECYRVSRPDGILFLEEPTVRAITIWDSVFTDDTGATLSPGQDNWHHRMPDRLVNPS